MSDNKFLSKKRHFLIKTYRLISEDSIMRSLHRLITSFVSSPYAYPECTYLCSSIVETKHHNHIFINMIAHTAAFVSTISPIYIQPQSGPWFEYPRAEEAPWSALSVWRVYNCIFANRSCEYMRDFPCGSNGCTNEFLFSTIYPQVDGELHFFPQKGGRLGCELLSYESSWC